MTLTPSSTDERSRRVLLEALHASAGPIANEDAH